SSAMETEVDNNYNEKMETETPEKKKRVRPIKRRGSKVLRTEHCSRLGRLLSLLLQNRRWKEASGVLSVLLKGTAREHLPFENRDKYLAAMELLKKMEGDQIKPINIKRIFEIWIRKNGAMKKGPVKFKPQCTNLPKGSRLKPSVMAILYVKCSYLFGFSVEQDKYSIQLENFLFCLMQGNIDEANQVVISLMQEKDYGSDPMLNMAVGLINYELWYACIPEEMKMRNSDIFERSMLSELSGFDSYNPVESTVSVGNQDVEVPDQGDSASSIGNNKNQHIEPDVSLQRKPSNKVIQPQGFYIEESSEESETKEANHGYNLSDTSVFNARGLDAMYLPIRLPDVNENLGNSIHTFMETLNAYYAKAVQHLRFALYSTPPVLASLLPLVQLLLLGDRVEEALKEVENIRQTSNEILPLRIRAILLECFDSKSSVMLSTCYEDIIKKDPTCSQSLAKLIILQKNGDYGHVSLLEMIALHLDATSATCSVWVELASCFIKLSHCDEDQISVCGSANEGVDNRCSTSTNTIPITFIHGHSRKSWNFRCRWWSKRHFSKSACVSEMEAGDWELLTSKAACASHLYRPEFEYVVSVHTSLLKAQKQENIMSLELHMKNSVKVSEQLTLEEIVLDDQSYGSN
ncbi:hypothetical protein IFM89_010876, partial [Coptis chinensis]